MIGLQWNSCILWIDIACGLQKLDKIQSYQTWLVKVVRLSKKMNRKSFCYSITKKILRKQIDFENLELSNDGIISFSKLRQPSGQRQSNVRTQQKKSIRPILFLYYDESLVSSKMNSKLFRFHCVRPNVHPYLTSMLHTYVSLT